jgi:hypothetical protein
MSDALKTPASRWRKPPRPAREVVPFAFPKPSPRLPPKKSGQQRRKYLAAKREGRRGDPSPPALAYPKPPGRAYDTPYMLEVKKLPCLLKGKPDHVCDGRSEADHAGLRPRGRKSNDRETIPMCPRAHRERTGFRGYFKTFDKVRMRNWCGDRIAEVQAKLAWVPVATEAA